MFASVIPIVYGKGGPTHDLGERACGWPTQACLWDVAQSTFAPMWEAWACGDWWMLAYGSLRLTFLGGRREGE
ncbi:hypothetical protein Hypma_014138 [Hypsizygus marmoreus]|uniref:Uncharacterized protein n=1 Tax=Hypsizygus marmoreus TaxID=39966 RepID=A0A369K8W2_HYPMA|nr:hypothetical protein Hypma_014138 [Hypsizygus marmoreus]